MPSFSNLHFPFCSMAAVSHGGWSASAFQATTLSSGLEFMGYSCPGTQSMDTVGIHGVFTAERFNQLSVLLILGFPCGQLAAVFLNTVSNHNRDILCINTLVCGSITYAGWLTVQFHTMDALSPSTCGQPLHSRYGRVCLTLSFSHLPRHSLGFLTISFNPILFL